MAAADPWSPQDPEAQLWPVGRRLWSEPLAFLSTGNQRSAVREAAPRLGSGEGWGLWGGLVPTHFCSLGTQWSVSQLDTGGTYWMKDPPAGMEQRIGQCGGRPCRVPSPVCQAWDLADSRGSRWNTDFSLGERPLWHILCQTVVLGVLQGAGKGRDTKEGLRTA